MQEFDGKKLAIIRKAAGYTQKALGEAIGTTERVVQQWEYNTRAPSATLLLRLMLLLNITAADLLTEEQKAE